MSLFEKLLTEIERIPVVDIHSRVRITSPAAQDLLQIALDNAISTELESAGVDTGAIDDVFESDNIKNRMERIFHGFDLIKNTTSYWCLTQILGDLYESGPLHECKVDELIRNVENTASDLGWVDKVLERANVAKVLVTCDWRKNVPNATEKFVPVLRVDCLVDEAHSSRTLEGLSEVTGHSVYDASDFNKAINELLRKAKEAGAVAVVASFEPQVDFDEGDRDTADRVLSMALLGQKIGRDDRKALRSYVMDQLLRSCADYDLPMQLMLGIRHIRSADRTIAAYEPGSVAMYAELFRRHDQVTFDVITSNETIHHELAIVARNYPNVLLSGSWWYLAFPAHIRKMFRERIEMIPRTKCCALSSDAGCVEWIYGRAKLIRRELAITLAQFVQEGYLSEGIALEVATSYLSKNPSRVYKI